MVEDRLRNIREGAGKEDNRYSELMTDLLQKSGPWIVGAVIVCSGGYLGYTWYENHKTHKLAAAFFELEEAIDSGSPKSLEAVARDHAGQRSVTRVAEAELGDIYLTAARRGVAPGATLVPPKSQQPPQPEPTADGPAAGPPKPEGAPERDEDLLTTEQVTQYLTKAATAFQATFDATKDDPVLALHTIKALFGLAAVAETKGDFEGAGRYYADASARATKAGIEPLVVLATKRKDSAAGLSTVTPLLKTAELPTRIEAASPFPTMPPTTTPPPGTVGTSTIDVKNPGSGVTVTKGSGPVPVSVPTGTTAPGATPPPASPAPATPSGSTPPAATPPAGEPKPQGPKR